MVPLELIGVRVEVPANTPMLLLREATGRHRLMPIYIGTPEATAIHYALEGVVPPRPLTHDLFIETLKELNTELTMVVVTEMREHTYFAELHLRTAEQTNLVISSRTSDAVALAVRCDCPIMTTKSPSPVLRNRRSRPRSPRGARRGRGTRDPRRVPRVHRSRQSRRLRLNRRSVLDGSLRPSYADPVTSS